MASLDHIATIFSEYKYDKDVGFEGNSGMPCLACISEIDRDIYCVCVTNDDPATCVVCKHYDKKCGSVSLVDECWAMRLTSFRRSLQSFSARRNGTGTLWLAWTFKSLSSTDVNSGAFVVLLRIAGRPGVN